MKLAARSVTLRYALALAACSSGCGLGHERIDEVDPDVVPAVVTYAQHIKPRVDYYCAACHNPDGQIGNAAGWNFESYQLVRAAYESIRVSTFVERRMPPGGARRMTSRDEAIFRRWKASGFPE